MENSANPVVTVIVKMKVRPEKHKELFQTVFSISQHVRKENGCLNLGFYLNAENENDFLVIEEWASQKDWDDHRQSNATAAGNCVYHRFKRV